MHTILFLRSSSTSALFSWRSLVSVFSLLFRDYLPGGQARMAKPVRTPTYQRLHASFVLAMAVVLACVIMAPTVAAMSSQ